MHFTLSQVKIKHNMNSHGWIPSIEVDMTFDMGGLFQTSYYRGISYKEIYIKIYKIVLNGNRS